MMFPIKGIKNKKLSIIKNLEQITKTFVFKVYLNRIVLSCQCLFSWQRFVK